MAILPAITRILVASTFLLLAIGALPTPALAQFGSIDAFISQQYRDVGRREPDVGGLGYWAPQGQTPSLVRGLLEEADSTQGAVVRLYFAYFNRMPDYGGFAWQTEQFAAGNYPGLSTISAAFYASPEYQSYSYGSLSNPDFVTLLYNSILGRAPDQAGLDANVQALNGGMPRSVLILNLSESAENKSRRYVDIRQYISTARMLHRAPTSLQPGVDLDTYISSILSSSEYSTRIAGSQTPLVLQDCNNAFPATAGGCVSGAMQSRVVDQTNPISQHFNELVFEVLPNLITNSVTYDPVNFTGVSVPSAVRPSFQLGRNDIGYDSAGNAIATPVVQLYNDKGGAVINTWWFDFLGSAASTQSALDFTYGIVWQFPDSALAAPDLRQAVAQRQPGRLTTPPIGFAGIRPFDTFDSQLMVQANVKVPTSISFLSPTVTATDRGMASTPNGPSAQAYIYLVFLDQVRGDTFFCLVGLYDNQGHQPEMIRPDDATGRPFCSFYLPVDGATPSSSFYNASPYSRGFSSATWSEDRFFRFHINRANMIRIINGINAMRSPQQQLSGDPSNYFLIDAAVQAEIVYAKHAGASPQDANARDNITLGYSFSGFSVWKLR